jgi:hypothetical protein
MAPQMLKSRRAWAAVAAAVLVGVPVVLAYRWLKPSDRVVVTVNNIDPSTRLLFLAAETPGGPEPMWWSLRKVTPFSMHPSRCVVSEYDPERNGSKVVKRVSWKGGSRYGVLVRDEGDRWLVFWFSPQEVHLRERYWVIGGGRASIELPAKEWQSRPRRSCWNGSGSGPRSASGGGSGVDRGPRPRGRWAAPAATASSVRAGGEDAGGQMDERGWLTSTDPRPMLAFLRDGGRASDRKLRLFACGCCRGIWDLLPDAGCREVVAAVERHADSRGGQDQVEAALQGAQLTVGNLAAQVVVFATQRWAWVAARSVVMATAGARGWFGQKAERKKQATLLRDIVGNPFRPLPVLPNSALAWNDGCLVKLATGIYEDRDFSPERMGVLADALEEAGADGAILDHLRGPDPHVRGCHVLDLLLSRE